MIFRKSLLAPLSLAAILCAGPLLGGVPSDDLFRVETLAVGLGDTIVMAVLPAADDDFIAERTGALKWYSPESDEVKLVKQFEVSLKISGLATSTLPTATLTTTKKWKFWSRKSSQVDREWGGEIPMPPNPQYNEEQASQMVDAILSLGESGHQE